MNSVQQLLHFNRLQKSHCLTQLGLQLSHPISHPSGCPETKVKIDIQVPSGPFAWSPTPRGVRRPRQSSGSDFPNRYRSLKNEVDQIKARVAHRWSAWAPLHKLLKDFIPKGHLQNYNQLLTSWGLIIQLGHKRVNCWPYSPLHAITGSYLNGTETSLHNLLYVYSNKYSKMTLIIQFEVMTCRMQRIVPAVCSVPHHTANPYCSNSDMASQYTGSDILQAQIEHIR